MRTITLEEHFATPEFLKATAQLQSAARVDFVKPVESKLLDLGQGRIADMDAAGIDLQVLSLTWAGLDRLEGATATALAHDANDRLAAAVREHPKRFAGFAALALQEPEKAAAEFERCVRALGFKGALVHGTTRGMFLDDPQFTPLFETAQALDVPIYLHPAPPPKPVEEAYFGGLPGQLGFLLATAAWGWHAETGMHSLRLIVSGLFDRFPRLKLIIGHMGETLPFMVQRLDRTMTPERTKLQRPVSAYLRENIHYTFSGFNYIQIWLNLVMEVGVDRIMFSADHPYASMKEARTFSHDSWESIGH